MPHHSTERNTRACDLFPAHIISPNKISRDASEKGLRWEHRSASDSTNVDNVCFLPATKHTTVIALMILIRALAFSHKHLTGLRPRSKKPSWNFSRTSWFVRLKQFQIFFFPYKSELIDLLFSESLENEVCLSLADLWMLKSLLSFHTRDPHLTPICNLEPRVHFFKALVHYYLYFLDTNICLSSSSTICLHHYWCVTPLIQMCIMIQQLTKTTMGSKCSLFREFLGWGQPSSGFYCIGL